MKRSSLKLVGVVGLILVMGVLGFLYSRWSKDQVDAATYREEPVERSAISTTILATGTVQPENRIEIKPPVAGRAEQILVEEGQRVTKGQILAWVSSTERAALMDAARAEGPAEVERWSKIYRPTPVVAPITGTIISRRVESGQTFVTSDAVLVMSDRLTVKAQVDETDIAQIKVKQAAEIVLDAYPGESLPATVDQIAFDAKTVNSVTTYAVDVLPNQTPAFMRSGMTANVTFQADSRDSALLVPTDALKLENGATTVLVRDPSGAPVSRPVTTGLSDGRRTEIVSGLTEGEIVLVPIFQLKKKEKSSSPFTPMGRPRGSSSSGGGGR